MEGREEEGKRDVVRKQQTGGEAKDSGRKRGEETVTTVREYSDDAEESERERGSELREAGEQEAGSAR